MPVRLVPPVVGDLVCGSLMKGIYRVLEVIPGSSYDMIVCEHILHNDYTPVLGVRRRETLCWGLFAHTIIKKSDVIERTTKWLERYALSLTILAEN